MRPCRKNFTQFCRWNGNEDKKDDIRKFLSFQIFKVKRNSLIFPKTVMKIDAKTFLQVQKWSFSVLKSFHRHARHALRLNIASFVIKFMVFIACFV